ncbi:arabinosaccharide transport system permease protein [Paenibacillus castaneae]|uniref:carbohydrate ABC transporter permease n=1 Tax=Paenibacillus castaneae TaxID=474957 RepID=UPI000C9BAD7C|nr:carbohydrate ABC transporter permease [Paenibacillus castaneae]NIK75798.1 arabinosaccharide transport system permease protein [Paenibacillus castaneae]
MKTTEKHKWSMNTVLLLLLFIVFAVFALFPLVTLLIASFKPAQELMRFGLNLRISPDIFSFKNYTYLFTGNSLYLTWYKNSLVITAIFTVLCLFFSSMVGYGLAVYQFRFRNFIFALVLITMMVPIEIIILPLYKLSINLNLINSIWGVILPFAAAPLPIFFFRQYASCLPKDFLDAARVDGTTEFGTFFRIMMPLMAPAFSSMAILQALFAWNNFLWPLIVLRTTEQLTIPIGLATLLTPYGNNFDMLISGAVVAIVPILLVFLFFQKYFIEGMTAGGVKG